VLFRSGSLPFTVPAGRILEVDINTVPELAPAFPGDTIGFISYDVFDSIHKFGAWTNDGGQTTHFGHFDYDVSTSSIVPIQDWYDGTVWLSNNYLVKQGIAGQNLEEMGTLSGLNMGPGGDITVLPQPEANLEAVRDEAIKAVSDLSINRLTRSEFAGKGVKYQDIVDGLDSQDEKKALSAKQGKVLSDAIAQEVTDRDIAIAQAQLATHTWLPAKAAKAGLLDPQTLTPTLNYLCRVINDTATPSNNGVWELVAGASEWTYFSDNADWIDELELNAALSSHNDSANAHPDIRNKIGTDINVHNGDNGAHSALLAGYAKLASPKFTGNPEVPLQPYFGGVTVIADQKKAANIEYVERAKGYVIKHPNTGQGIDIKLDNATYAAGTEVLFDIWYNETTGGTLVAEARVHGQFYTNETAIDTRHGMVQHTNIPVAVYVYQDESHVNHIWIPKIGASNFPSVRVEAYKRAASDSMHFIPALITQSVLSAAPSGTLVKINDATFAPDRSLDGNYLLSRPDLWPNGVQVEFPNKLAGMRFAGTYNTGAVNENVKMSLGDDTIFPKAISKVLEYGGHAGGITNSPMVQFPVNCNSPYFFSNNANISNIIGLKVQSVRILTFNHKDSYAELDTTYDFWVKYILV
jgi:hypothetical protein